MTRVFANPVRGKITPYPLNAPPGTFQVTQPFGSGKGVFSGEPTLGKVPFHRGLDLGDERCGAAVLAPADGVVKWAGKLGNGEIVVILNHGDGWGSSYGHLADKQVKDGDRVTKGQKLGDVGKTGFANGCHLHFAVKDRLPDGWGRLDFVPNPLGGTGDNSGRWVDPWPLLEQNQEDDMYPVTRYLPGSQAVVKTSARIRSAPSGTATVLRTLAGPETWTVIGFVKGELAEGSADWLERWSGTAYEYTHSVNVGTVSPPAAADCTDVVAKANAAGYATAKNAAAAAVAGI